MRTRQTLCAYLGKGLFERLQDLNASGAGTLSITTNGRRSVLRQCVARSHSAKFFPFPVGGRTALVYSGEVKAGDFNDFVDALETVKPENVIIDSPGGDVREAMRIGMEIRNRDLNTFLRSNHQCASACALIFFAGRTKFLSRSARIGLHSASNADGTASSEGTMLMEGYLLAMGLPQDLLNRMREYGPDEMMWLSEQDKRTLKVVNLWP